MQKNCQLCILNFNSCKYNIYVTGHLLIYYGFLLKYGHKIDSHLSFNYHPGNHISINSEKVKSFGSQINLQYM